MLVVSGTPYTETFLRVIATATNVSWNCPIGKRAVVTSIVAVNAGSNPGSVHVTIAGVYVLVASFQVGEVRQPYQLRCVCYGGQAILVHHTAAGLHSQVTGYLFEDLTLANGPPGAVVRELAEVPTLLPASAGAA